MKAIFLQAILIFFSLQNAWAQKASKEKSFYFPPAGSWTTRTPEQSGMNGQQLDAAVRFAIDSEVKNPRSMEQNHYQTFGKNEPFGDAIGPMKDRGEPTGIIIHKGYVVATWGEPDQIGRAHV